MNREIKFRVWCHGKSDNLNFNHKRWWGLEEFILIKYYPSVHSIGNDDNFSLSQFTGLKDKNGKDIYEGDIVKKYWKTENGWTDNGFSPYPVVWNQQHCGFGLNWGKSHVYEVIGNIFENPELLS